MLFIRGYNEKPGVFAYSGYKSFKQAWKGHQNRWGRVLMRRAEAIKAKSQNTNPVTLFEVDYLLGVNDEARQGALRFSQLPHENVFLSPKHKTSIPPLISLTVLFP